MTSATHQIRGSRAHRSVQVAFGALGLAVGSWGSRIPDVKADLDLSEGALGNALLGMAVGAVLGAWIGGLLVRLLGTRRTVATGWALVSLAVMPLGSLGSWAALAGGLLVMGVAVGVLDVSMNGAGVQLEQAAGEPLLSGMHAGWSAGVLVGAGLGAIAVGFELAVTSHLVAIGAVGLLLAVGFVRFLPDGEISPVDHADDADSSAVGRTTGRLAALAAIGACVFLAEGALIDWAGVLVREDLDGGALLGALAVTGVSAGGLAGRLMGDRLALAWGSSRLVRGGVVMATLALGGVLLSPPPALVPLMLVLVGAGLAPAVPLAFAAAGQIWGERGIAVVTTTGYGALLAGPALIGRIAHSTSLRLALVLPLVLVASVALLAGSTDDGDQPAVGR